MLDLWKDRALFDYLQANFITKKKSFDKSNKNIKKKKENKKKDKTSNVAFLTKEISKKSESKDIEWIIDLAASSHMTANRKILEDFAKHTNSRVIVDNAKLEMKGKNKEHIPLVAEEKTMIVSAKEVLYVPKLHVNLQSVNQMAKNDLMINFDREKCEITNDAIKVIATGTAVDNIYSLDQFKDIYMRDC